MAAALNAEGFQAATNVSRETLERLEAYCNLLRVWQGRVNLVGPGTLNDIWHRHFLDSAQLLALAPPPPDGRDPVWIDVGSGGGFPGMVLAIMGAGQMHLVEATQKKCAFLAEVARVTKTSVDIHACRVEDLDAAAVAPGGAHVVTARAVVPLAKLLGWMWPLCGRETVLLIPAGQDFENALTAAAKSWKMIVDRLPSVTRPASTIVRIHGLAPNGPK